MRTLFVFRRDLRLEDNTALNAALEMGDVVPAFILDGRQLKSNKYKSDNAVQFMFESLVELDTDLKKKGSGLSVLEGKAEEIIAKLAGGFDAVAVNADYTPFSIRRDRAIEQKCNKKGTRFIVEHDALLTAPGSIMTGDGNPYRVYSHFMKKASAIEVPKPKTKKGKFGKPLSGNEGLKKLEGLFSWNKEIFAHGGRSKALRILDNIDKFRNYESVRNFPAKNGTTGLSPHNKFGTASIREVYYAIAKKLGRKHQLISELYWRDFFTHIIYHFPKVLGQSFHGKYDKIKWSLDKNRMLAWKMGITGFPIVDAGMRELNATGFMHNRVRMIAASFLVKDLHMDWREGERYFASKLIDYDPAVNNGNWQWAASTGCDAQPYFRIFNPWLQQKRYDPECEYIKKWVPELSGLSPKEIHSGSWNSDTYAVPIVNHRKESEKAKKEYRKVSRKA